MLRSRSIILLLLLCLVALVAMGCEEGAVAPVEEAVEEREAVEEEVVEEPLEEEEVVEETEEGEATVPAGTGETVTVFVFADDPFDAGNLEQVVEQFNQSNEITIELEIQGIARGAR